jgi:hypothetical protein
MDIDDTSFMGPLHGSGKVARNAVPKLNAILKKAGLK